MPRRDDQLSELAQVEELGRRSRRAAGCTSCCGRLARWSRRARRAVTRSLGQTRGRARASLASARLQLIISPWHGRQGRRQIAPSPVRTHSIFSHRACHACERWTRACTRGLAKLGFTCSPPPSAALLRWVGIFSGLRRATDATYVLHACARRQWAAMHVRRGEGTELADVTPRPGVRPSTRPSRSYLSLCCRVACMHAQAMLGFSVCVRGGEGRKATTRSRPVASSPRLAG